MSWHAYLVELFALLVQRGQKVDILFRFLGLELLEIFLWFRHDVVCCVFCVVS